MTDAEVVKDLLDSWIDAAENSADYCSDLGPNKSMQLLAALKDVKCRVERMEKRREEAEAMSERQRVDFGIVGDNWVATEKELEAERTAHEATRRTLNEYALQLAKDWQSKRDVERQAHDATKRELEEARCHISQLRLVCDDSRRQRDEAHCDLERLQSNCADILAERDEARRERDSSRNQYSIEKKAHLQTMRERDALAERVKTLTGPECSDGECPDYDGEHPFHENPATKAWDKCQNQHVRPAIARAERAEADHQIALRKYVDEKNKRVTLQAELVEVRRKTLEEAAGAYMAWDQDMDECRGFAEVLRALADTEGSGT